jgi:hypothetical protein
MKQMMAGKKEIMAGCIQILYVLSGCIEIMAGGIQKWQDTCRLLQNTER